MNNALRWTLRVLTAALTLLAVGLIVTAGLWYTWQAADETKRDTPFEITASRVERWAIGLYLRQMYGDQMNAPANPDDSRERTFVIRSGETLTGIAQRLEREGLVSNAELFRRMVQYWGADSDIQAGVFELRPDMTMEQMVRNLQHGRLPAVTVTVPEGLRAEQIAALLDESDVVEAEAFLAAVRSGVSGNPLLDDRPAGSPASIEGFLFPDTYQFPLNASAARIVEIMVSTWQGRMPADMLARANATGRSVYEVVTLASIVEREAVVADEQPLIAGVYAKRLEDGMYLQADPTVQYARGYDAEADDWWRPLTIEEYSSIASPYNTYLNPGLPPSPICNPGLGAIEAALQPVDTPYRFFVAQGDGSHVFAETYEEHVRNIEQVGGQVP
ncbi:MAG: endolytic transglycosylase MltG [Chloroflexi bacterium]|jgi:UPF0755 protein|nr:endolytic transglycosylase MltG [Chloroflexota bacterium]